MKLRIDATVLGGLVFFICVLGGHKVAAIIGVARWLEQARVLYEVCATVYGRQVIGE